MHSCDFNQCPVREYHLKIYQDTQIYAESEISRVAIRLCASSLVQNMYDRWKFLAVLMGIDVDGERVNKRWRGLDVWVGLSPFTNIT